MDIQKIYPLIIKNNSGNIINVSLSNEKGFNKSIERNTLWHLHSDTGRLLPYDESAQFISITKHRSWYETVLKTGETPQPSREQVDSAVPRDKPEEAGETGILHALERIIIDRKINLPEGSYTTHLFTSGGEKIRKKTGEEAVELILAGSREEIIYEAADLIYHLMVLLAHEGIGIDAVLDELSNR